LPFNFDRASSATRVNKQGLIETVGADQPRIDYLNDSNGALLLEPSRTNSLLQSNQFDTTWVLSVSIDLTSGQSGVFGSNDAWLLKRNSTGSRYIQQSLSLSSAQYSYSVYLKAESTNWAFLWSYDGGVTSVNAYFDLENGVVGQISGAALDGTNIESVGNGWYRCTLIYTHAPDLIRIYPANSNGNISIGTDNGIYIQHAQLEVGSYATSIINTQGSAVTRLSDVCNNGGNEQVINSTEGVLYAEISALLNTADSSKYITISDGTYNNRASILFSNGSTNQIRTFLRVGGVPQIDVSDNVTDVTDFNKVAFSYKENDFKVYINGSLVSSDTSGSVWSADTITKLSFSEINTSGGLFNGNVKDVRVYNTALTDQELIALTQV
jgi:hypothetical protein